MNVTYLVKTFFRLLIGQYDVTVTVSGVSLPAGVACSGQQNYSCAPMAVLPTPRPMLCDFLVCNVFVSGEHYIFDVSVEFILVKWFLLLV